jgi:DNA polymerase III sliding clamp (beta) subunit (PCNA family)
MHIKLETTKIKEILGILSGLARTSAKALEDKSNADFILLTADQGAEFVTFGISTREETLEIDCEAEIVEHGSAFVPIAKFATIVNNTISETLSIRLVNLESGAISLRITGTKFSASVPTKLVQEMAAAWSAPDLEIPIEVEPLRALIQRCKKALLPESGPAFQSIRLVFRPGGVWAVAASNQKVAGAKYENAALINRADALIPTLTLASFEKILSNLDGEILLGVDSSKLSIRSENLRYSTLAAVQGPPAVAQLYRTDGMNSVLVDSSEFSKALKLVSAGVAAKTGAKNYVHLQFLRESVKISSAEDGSVATEIQSEYPEGHRELVLAFKLDYVADVIGKSKKLRVWYGQAEADRTIWEWLDDPFAAKFVVSTGRL